MTGQRTVDREPPEPVWLHEDPAYTLESAPAAPVPAGRCYFLVGCPSCTTEDRFAPPHDASRRCESGRHAHCSCDRCF